MAGFSGEYGRSSVPQGYSNGGVGYPAGVPAGQAPGPGYYPPPGGAYPGGAPYPGGPAAAHSFGPQPGMGYPGPGNPFGPHTPPPRSPLPIIVIVAVLGLVVVLVGAAAAFYLSRPADDEPAEASWEMFQYIQDDFPGLVPVRPGPWYIASDPGWKQVVCRTGATVGGYEFVCHHQDGSGIYFVIKDYTIVDGGLQGRLNSEDFREEDYERDVVIQPETQSVTNPTLDAPAQLTVPAEGSSAAYSYQAYFSFPADPTRRNYLIMVKWPGHTADDILREWWAQAPLER